MGTRSHRISAALAAGLAALAICLPQAEANIVGAGASPARANIAGVGAASVTVNWQVMRESFDLPNPGIISSPNLRILIDGTPVATLPNALSRQSPGDTTTETIRLREVVRIPRSLVYRAVKEGHVLVLTRRFTDSFDNTFEDAAFEVRPSGGGAAVLTVQRLELKFDDEARSRVLPRGSELRVTAELNASGTGLLQAQWEVATGATTPGTPVFRPLSLVRQGIGVSGRAVLTSPPLPTADEGTHLVRLRLIEPRHATQPPALHYYVTPGSRPESLVAQREILLTGPRPGAPLTADTRFAWSAVPGVDAYQLAFFAAPAGPAEPLDPARDTGTATGEMAPKTAPDGAEAVAGIFVAGTRTETGLETSTLAQLPGDRRYLWKVTAIGANGAIIGTSSAREIYKP